MDVCQKPRFRHSCENCVTLGQFNEFDLYFCAQAPHCRPTVVARFGNADAEYASGLLSAAELPELGEARRRAIAAGLLSANSISGPRELLGKGTADPGAGGIERAADISCDEVA
jgi:hypothetical protein